MRNKVLLTLFFLMILGVAHAAPSKIGWSTRKQMGEMLTRIVEREVAKAPVKVTAVKASKKRVLVYTSKAMAYYPFREENTRAIYDSIRAILPPQYRHAAIAVYSDREEISNLIPLAYRTTHPRKAKDAPVRFTNTAERPLISRVSHPATPTQGLLGRHLALWQSHGRYFDQEKNVWRWQRSLLWETCEDLYTQSYVLPYLVPMLENAGATVMLPRERDVQLVELLADNDHPETYREEGAWTEGGVGFMHRQQIYRTRENPFRHGTTRQCLSVTSHADHQAVWMADVPEKGEYGIYVSYSTSVNSTDDARYTVHHAGGETDFSVNQTMGGGTWIYLGRFLLEEGEQEVVTLSNRSRLSGRVVSADAVKIGGGFGNIVREVDEQFRKSGVEYVEETSGYPRFCEGARYWLQWAGFDEKVYAGKNHLDDYKEDYMSRAHWVNALMGGSERLKDSVGLNIPIDMALAFHSDAGVREGDEIVGTLGIFYTRENKGRFQGGASRYRSRDLTDMVMTQIVGDIRKVYEPEWMRRGLWNRAYYEARVPSAPTMLLELLAHQNFADMRYGNDPRFKFFVSRAVYKGVLRYLASQYQTPYVVQPLPVEAFSVEFWNEDSVRLTWSAVEDELERSASPTGYIVYTRRGEGGFDNGRYVEEPTCIMPQDPDVVYSYRVTAVNEGGESFPSETLAACRVKNDRGRVLVVNGFERVSAPYSQRKDSLAGFYHEIDGGVADRQDISFVGRQRIFDLKMAGFANDSLALGACYNNFETDVIGGNTFDYPAMHGRSIAKAGYSFASASVKAVEQGMVSLRGYPIVDLILGKQRAIEVARGVRGVEFSCFTPRVQDLLRRYAAGGGSLLVSGSYVASDLYEGLAATDESRQFAEEVLRLKLDRGQASKEGRVRITTRLNGFSRGDYHFHTDLGRDYYTVESPDAFVPCGDAEAVMRYAENQRVAAVGAREGGGVLVMGFPIESLTDESQRDRLFRDALRFFNKR